MDYLDKPIGYLQDNDFDQNGRLINQSIPKNIPTIVMIQAMFCGYCREAKPAFQEFANSYQGKVCCLTIQGDGKEPGEAQLASPERINQIKPGFRGYPEYVLYYGGDRVDKDIKGRDVPDLIEFAFN